MNTLLANSKTIVTPTGGRLNGMNAGLVIGDKALETMDAAVTSSIAGALRLAKQAICTGFVWSD
ncbi:MAG TPA: hypothetical protein PLY75_04835, partial [Gammaproteobacteria bacterium]|nr:hypothetical protein [Gammaproteobacteria bacterium]HPQ24241.1 hypothetical protein [Gammaproteobacteria bacterium]